MFFIEHPTIFNNNYYMWLQVSSAAQMEGGIFLRGLKGRSKKSRGACGCMRLYGCIKIKYIKFLRCIQVPHMKNFTQLDEVLISV